MDEIEKLFGNDFDRPSLFRKEYVVYVLLCPTTKSIRYVGKTRQVKIRRWTHTQQIFESPELPVQRWTTQLIQAGTPPIFKVVCKLQGVNLTIKNEIGRSAAFYPDNEIHDIEKKLIARCVELGCDLLNVATMPIRS